jgi:flagellar basal body-associated protein FliL
MAEKAKDKKEAAPATPAEGGVKKAPIWTKTPVLITAVMVLEAVALIGVFKLLGGGHPQPAAAEVALAGGEEGHGDGHGGPGATTKSGKLAEVPMLAERFPNVNSGRRYLYDVAIVVLVKAEHKTEIEGIFKEREAMIKDRVRTIIAQSDPTKLGTGDEPGLETLRRQVKHQLEEIVGKEGMIQEILVPRCIPFRVD